MTKCMSRSSLSLFKRVLNLRIILISFILLVTKYLWGKDQTFLVNSTTKLVPVRDNMLFTAVSFWNREWMFLLFLSAGKPFFTQFCSFAAMTNANSVGETCRLLVERKSTHNIKLPWGFNHCSKKNVLFRAILKENTPVFV